MVIKYFAQAQNAVLPWMKFGVAAKVPVASRDGPNRQVCQHSSIASVPPLDQPRFASGADDPRAHGHYCSASGAGRAVSRYLLLMAVRTRVVVVSGSARLPRYCRNPRIPKNGIGGNSVKGICGVSRCLRCSRIELRILCQRVSRSWPRQQSVLRPPIVRRRRQTAPEVRCYVSSPDGIPAE